MTSQITATQFWMLSPQLSLVLLSFVVVGLDLLTRSRAVALVAALIGLLVPLFFTFSLAFSWFGSYPATGFFGMLTVDGFGLFFDFLFLGIGFAMVIVSYGYVGKFLRASLGEYYAIVLMSLTGMMLMGSTTELITIYISFELTSIPLYILAGLSRAGERSAEASVK